MVDDLDSLELLAPRHAPATVREAARRRLRAVIAAEEARPMVVGARKAVSLAAATLVMVVAALGWVLLHPPGANAALEQLARVVERIPPTEFPDGALLYTRSEQLSLTLLPGTDLPELGVEEFALLLPQTREIWIAQDGSSQLRVTTHIPVFFDDPTAQAFQHSDLPALLGIGSTSTETYGPSEDRINPTDWPTDPDRLEQAMLSEAARRGPQDLPISARLVDVATSLLRETGAQPDLRAAILRVLAQTDDLDISEWAEPPLLRVSATYQDEIGRWTHTIGFDPDGNLITDTKATLDGIPAVGVPPNTITSHATYQPTTAITTSAD